ncbi:ribbon-helix-helix domain-containing protein [Methylobacterium sp. SI9]|uniref:ribbon-helix-helix domain-containing protein n=1 Tax=Methylobacterium guangdongense TaxID=3138811 RepID=UPI00313EA7EA
MSGERQKLTVLADRLAKKSPAPEAEKPVEGEAGSAADSAADSAVEAPAPQPVAAKGKGADTRVQIIVRMTPAERKALRQIALDQDTTAQALAEDAIRDVLRRHGFKAS